MPWVYKAKYINEGANVTQVTTQPGALQALVVGIAVAGNVAVYDSASANENQVLNINSNAVQSHQLNIRISNGLRVVYPANCALTVVYK